jgi:hypothetical protein
LSKNAIDIPIKNITSLSEGGLQTVGFVWLYLRIFQNRVTYLGLKITLKSRASKGIIEFPGVIEELRYCDFIYS